MSATFLFFLLHIFNRNLLKRNPAPTAVAAAAAAAMATRWQQSQQNITWINGKIEKIVYASIVERKTNQQTNSIILKEEPKKKWTAHMVKWNDTGMECTFFFVSWLLLSSKPAERRRQRWQRNGGGDGDGSSGGDSDNNVDGFSTAIAEQTLNKLLCIYTMYIHKHTTSMPWSTHHHHHHHHHIQKLTHHH